MAPKRPNDFDDGLSKYTEFSQFAPKKINTFNFKIPKKLHCIGDATWTYYESKKWENKNNWYKHEHEGGVKIYVPKGNMRGFEHYEVDTPDWIYETATLVKLGNSLGYEFQDLTGATLEAVTSKPYPELYCIPSGRALLVIQSKRQLVACFWGGYLDVTARGIVG